MSNFTFRPATRENVGLLIGLAGGTGAGKTFSALRLASGIAGGKKFGAIDTEGRRMLHYADQFDFDHGDLGPPFTPDRYIEAIMAADKAGYPVIVVDSMSHVWAGDGGILDWQQNELERMGGEEKHKMRSWIKPKMAHKQMVQKLLQVHAHLILCFRAEEKIAMKPNPNKGGKMEVNVKEGPTGLNGWFPVCEKNLPFELTASFLLMAENPGIPLAIKLQEQHKPLFERGKLIDEEAGRRIAEWASGGKTPEPQQKSTSAASDSDEPSTEGKILGKMTAKQSEEVLAFMKKENLNPGEMLELVQTSFEADNIGSSADLKPRHAAKLKIKFDKMKQGEIRIVRDNGPIHFEAVTSEAF